MQVATNKTNRSKLLEAIIYYCDVFQSINNYCHLDNCLCFVVLRFLFVLMLLPKHKMILLWRDSFCFFLCCLRVLSFVFIILYVCYVLFVITCFCVEFSCCFFCFLYSFNFLLFFAQAP